MAGTTGKKKNKKKNQWENPYGSPKVPNWKPKVRAQNEINEAFQPALTQLDRNQEEAGERHDEWNTAAGNIYKGWQAEMDRMPDTMQQYKGISNQLSQATGGMGANPFGTNNPLTGNEGAAAQGVANQTAIGGQQALASTAQRQMNWTNSTRMQGATDHQMRVANELDDYQDLLSDIDNQRFDLNADMGRQLLTRIDELRDQKFGHQMTASQYGLNEWQMMQEARNARRLQKMIDEMLNGGGGGKGNKNKGNKGGPGKPPKSQSDTPAAGTGSAGGGSSKTDNPNTNPGGPQGPGTGSGLDNDQQLHVQAQKLEKQIEKLRMKGGVHWDPKTKKWKKSKDAALPGVPGAGETKNFVRLNRLERELKRIQRQLRGKPGGTKGKKKGSNNVNNPGAN